MNSALERNINRMARVFPAIMHFFHHVAGQVSKFGEFSLAQYRVLMLLYHRGSLTVNDLKRELGTAQSTASGMIERLVNLGLVIRDKNPDDLRIRILKLTPKAQKIIKTRINNMTEVYAKVLQDFSEEEGTQLIRSLEKISEILQTKKTKSQAKS